VNIYIISIITSTWKAWQTRTQRN